MATVPALNPEVIHELRSALKRHFAAHQQTVLDAKTVASAAPLFGSILGLPLKRALIRSEGYLDVDEMVLDILPKLQKQASQWSTMVHRSPGDR